MGVLDPIKVTLVNYPKDETEIIKAAYNPNDINSGERNISISRNIFIDKNDFMEFPEKKYFRLAPGKEVRLRHAFNITCEKLIKDNNGEILELECTYDPISRDMSKGNKVKGMIHWVDANNCIDAQINVYDRLFSDSDPTSVDDFNENSLMVKKGSKLEKNIDLNNNDERYQFERVGYFIKDSKSSNEKISYNKIVSLKDSWKKINKKGI